MEAIPEFIVSATPAIAIVLLAIGLCGYAIALASAAFTPTSTLGKSIAIWITTNPSAYLGIPCSALASFALVSALLRAFPAPTKDGEVLIEAFSLKFSGPSGPVTLWLICFLGFTFAIKLLKN